MNSSLIGRSLRAALVCVLFSCCGAVPMQRAEVEKIRTIDMARVATDFDSRGSVQEQPELTPLQSHAAILIPSGIQLEFMLTI